MNTKAEYIAYAKKNLVECSAEILEWNRTALLKDGKDHDIQIAESIVKTAALEAVIAQHFNIRTVRD